MKILLVTGSREILNYKFVFLVLDEIKKEFFDFDEILTGGAEGVDFLAHLYALYHNLSYEEKKPNWERYGKSAGFIRNSKMVDMCHKGVAIWDGYSRGTQHCIHELERAKKLIRVFEE